jgi:hypothetical protein
MKICPKCHAQQLDDTQDECKNCKGIRFINLADSIYLEKSQLNEVADIILKSPRLLLPLVLALFVFGIVVYESAESKVSKSIKETKEKTDQQLADAYRQISSHITTTLDETNFQILVQKIVADRSDRMMKNQIQPEVDEFRTNLAAILSESQTTKSNILVLAGETSAKVTLAEQKVKILDDSIQKANETLQKLDETIDFTLLVAEAESDNRLAFDRLVEISSSNNPRFSSVARNTVDKIISASEESYLISKNNLTANWQGIGIDPNTNTLQQLKIFYEQHMPSIRKYLISYIATADRFTKIERLDFVAKIIQNDVFLSAKINACYMMDEEAKLHKNIMAANEYLVWWEKNRPNYNTNASVIHPK